MVSHSGLITVMTRAARKAAPRLRRDFGEVEQLQVSKKGPADFVSMADKRADGRGEITHGMVYQPLTDESFWAEKGRGAWLHDARLRVSARRDLADCIIGTGIPFLGRGNPATWAKIYMAVAPQVAGIRRFGSAALDLAWVAAGRMDGFFEDSLDRWDSAAGILLVREAGGFVSDYRGSDQMFSRGEYVAANGDIHSRLHKLVAGALR